jgi:hypothetical protein
VRITIDTETDDFHAAVEAVYAAFGEEMDWEWEQEEDESETGRDAAARTASSVLSGGWTEKKLAKWASYLKPNARALTLYIAQNAPEVDFDKAAAELGRILKIGQPVEGKLLGGTMSSGGHALKHVAGVKTQPMDRDWGRRAYVMDEKVAETLVKVLTAEP